MCEHLVNSTNQIRRIFMTFSIKGIKAAALGAAIVVGFGVSATAQDLKFFTIGKIGRASGRERVLRLV